MASLQLNHLQTLFVQWRAKMLGISEEESALRFLKSWNVFPHDGDEFRLFIRVAHALLLPFYNDSKNEISEAHCMHQEIHMLRWMSYPLHAMDINIAQGKKEVNFLDYGCGMGALSIESALEWRKQGVNVRLYMLDIQTIMTDFLEFVTRKMGIESYFLPHTWTPGGVAFDIVLVSEVWEHLYDPVKVLKNVDKVLKVGGHLVTMFEDKQPEMFHVTPDLSKLRKHFEKLDYTSVGQYVWRKNV